MEPAAKKSPLAATGEHHVLSIAESLRRGLSPELCVAQACAHDHPGAGRVRATGGGLAEGRRRHQRQGSLQGRACGKGRQNPAHAPPYEGFVTHLADHDWVLSVPAAQWTVDALKQVAVRSYGIKEADLTKKPFNQFRNYVLSQKTAMQLYGAYSTKGLDGLTAEVAEIVRA